jgi:lysyl-tRNA synthetase class I
MHSTPDNTEHTAAEQVRLRVGKSRNWVAACANVSPQLVRIYEIDPNQVRDAAKRRALEKVYAQLDANGPAELQAELQRAAGI